MKQERGISLIELLAALALVGIISVTVISVLINGMNSYDRNTVNQRMQQEANYITEVIKKEYLQNETAEITLAINNSAEQMMMNGKVISEGYTYQFSNPAELTKMIKRTEDTTFQLTLHTEGTADYTINTTFSKLR